MKSLFTTLMLLATLTVSCNKDGGSSEVASLDLNLEGDAQTKPTSPTSPPATTPKPQVPDQTAQSWNEEFLDLINNHRASIGLAALIDNEDIGAIARTHSANMASGKVAFGHDGFTTRCSQAYAVMGGGSACGENVAYGQTSPQNVFNSWMNSSGHQANIENARYTHSGFGYVKNSSGRIYWTHIFIRR